MQELIALHDQILALPENTRPAEGVNFSKNDVSKGVAHLPAALRGEIETVRQAIKATLPENFDGVHLIAVVSQDQNHAEAFTIKSS